MNSTMTTKRTRQANYSNEEKVTLLNVVTKYKNIISNKKTDHATWKEKEDAWNKIERDFNAVSPVGIHRSASQLRCYFENLKKKTRKLAADEKLSIKKTGSGPPDIQINDPAHDLTLALMNKKTVYGLDNIYDCDKILIPSTEIGSTQKIVEEQEYILLEDECINKTSEYGDSVITLESDLLPESNLPSASLLQTPASRESSGSLKTKNWCNRRRPRPPSLPKNELADLYKQVAEEKLAFYKLQNSDMETKRKRDSEEYYKKIEREEEEFQLRKKILLTELQIKEEQLKTAIKNRTLLN